jgi:hypothetical protein
VSGSGWEAGAFLNVSEMFVVRNGASWQAVPGAASGVRTGTDGTFRTTFVARRMVRGYDCARLDEDDRCYFIVWYSGTNPLTDGGVATPIAFAPK